MDKSEIENQIASLQQRIDALQKGDLERELARLQGDLAAAEPAPKPKPDARAAARDTIEKLSKPLGQYASDAERSERIQSRVAALRTLGLVSSDNPEGYAGIPTYNGPKDAA